MNSGNTMKKHTFLLAILALLVSLPCYAQTDAQFQESVEDSTEYAEEQGTSIYERTVFAPVPMANPTLGAGLVGVAMYMHPDEHFGNDKPKEEDDATLQSITGAALMGTSNRSWAAGLFHKGFYDNDNYRATAHLAYGEFNLKFYGIGDGTYLRDNPIKYKTNVTSFKPQFLFRVTDSWYIGPQYRIMAWHMFFNFSNIHEILPDLDHTFTTGGFGLAGEWDTTDHSLYPSKGGRFQFSALDYGDMWGGDFDYLKYESNYSQFYTLTEDFVFAGRADLNLSSGSTPFFDMPYLHLRGFPYARYIDKQSASLQGEFRYHVNTKVLLNLFGGFGWIAETVSDFKDSKAVPTGGFGIGYLIAEEQSMHLSMDVAFAPESEAVYFRVGQWF